MSQMITLEEAHRLQVQAIEGLDDEGLKQATNYIEAICQSFPDTVEPLFALANSYLAFKRFGIAIPLYRRIIEMAPQFAPAYNNLGNCYRGVHDVEKGIEIFSKALKLKRSSEILNNYGSLFVNEGCPETAIPIFQEALQLDGSNTNAHWNLGLTLLESEQWAEGFHHYGWGLTAKDRMQKFYSTKYWETKELDEEPRWWDGRAHPHDTIIVYGEQGVGDELLFASMLEDIGVCFNRVILDCHERLATFFAYNFPWIYKIYPTRKVWDQPLDWAQEEKAEWKVAIADAAEFLRQREEDFPRQAYLRAPPELVERFLGELQDLPKPLYVVSWKGGYNKTRKDLRSIELPTFKPVIEALGGTWISAQYTDDAGQEIKDSGLPILEFPNIFASQDASLFYPLKEGERIMVNGEVICHKEKRIAKQLAKQFGCMEIEGVHNEAFFYEYRAAFLEAVRRLGGQIITVNTTLVHLCGAMGIPAIVLTPFKCAWRYGMTRTDMIWYPKDSIYQIRGKDGEPWAEVMPRLIEKLKERQ